MPINSVNDLKKVLFETYEGFGDKRLKRLESGDYFIVDDRGAGDKDARGNLFLWFCQIGLRVIDKDTVTLILRGGVPRSSGVNRWLESMGAEETSFGIEIAIKRGREKEISKLASAFRAITRPGARYTVSAYKYVCPRAASSLERLVKVLTEA